MNYLADSEFQTYGLEPDTPESWVSAASSLINSYCNRPTLWISQFTERIRLTPGRNNLRLTYLPLASPRRRAVGFGLRAGSLRGSSPR